MTETGRYVAEEFYRRRLAAMEAELTVGNYEVGMARIERYRNINNISHHNMKTDNNKNSGGIKNNPDKLPEVMDLDKHFNAIFGVSFLKYLDAELARLGYGAHLNVVQFDDYLQKKYDDYVDGISMNEFLEMKFGKDVSQFVEGLI